MPELKGGCAGVSTLLLVVYVFFCGMPKGNCLSKVWDGPPPEPIDGRRADRE